MSIGKLPYMINENQTCEAYYDWEKSCYCSSTTHPSEWIVALGFAALAGFIKGVGLMGMKLEYKSCNLQVSHELKLINWLLSKQYIIGIFLWLVSFVIEILSQDISKPIMISLLVNGGTFIVTIILSEFIIAKEKLTYIRFLSIVGCFLGAIQILSNSITPIKHPIDELEGRMSHYGFWIYIGLLFFSGFGTKLNKLYWKAKEKLTYIRFLPIVRCFLGAICSGETSVQNETIGQGETRGQDETRSDNVILSQKDWKKLYVFITNICIVACYSTIVSVFFHILKNSGRIQFDSDSNELRIRLHISRLLIFFGFLFAILWLIRKLYQSFSQSPTLFTIVVFEEGAKVIFGAITYSVVYQKLPVTISNIINIISGICILTVSLYFLFRHELRDVLKNVSVEEDQITKSIIAREPDAIHLRHCLLYEFDKQPENKKNAKLAYDNICEAYRKDVISQQTAGHWFAKFKENNFDLNDAPIPGRLDTYIATKPAQFFSNGINKLIERWRYIVDNDGIYHEE